MKPYVAFVSVLLSGCRNAPPAHVSDEDPPVPEPAETTRVPASATLPGAAAPKDTALLAECLGGGPGGRGGGPIDHAWAPNANRIAVVCPAPGDPRSIFVGLVEPGATPREVAVSAAFAGPTTAGGPSVRFRSDGRALLVGAAGNEGGYAGASMPAVWTVGTARPSELPAFLARCSDFWLSADWTLAACLAAPSGGELSLLDAQSGHVRSTLPGTPRIAAVAPSPDGRFVMVSSSGAADVWETDTGKRVKSFTDPPSFGPAVDIVWTRDGRTVFFRREPRTPVDPSSCSFCCPQRVYAWNVVTGAMRGSWKACRFAITPSGETVFLETARSTEIRATAPDGRASRLVYRWPQNDYPYGWGTLSASPDGRWLTGHLSTMSGTGIESFDGSKGGQKSLW
jgi:hypothetical protein